MRAFTYFRADPNAPKGHPGNGVTLQRAFEQYCATRGHTGQGVFSDDASSSETPQYLAMLERIHSSGLAYLIVVPAVDHLGDSLAEQVGHVLELDVLNCQVVCDAPDLPDPLQAALRATKGQGRGGARRHAIREGMKAKAARAQGLGKPPYGYRIGVNGGFEPVPPEAEVVQSIFSMYLDQGVGVRTIARQLNTQSIRTRRGRAWSMVTIRDILRNHSYIGTYHRFGLLIPTSHQPIVGADEFKQVQDRMRSRTPGRRHPKADPFLLSGILYCGHCGQRMMGVTRHQTWHRKNGERVRGEYRYYQCQSRINRSQCQYHTRRAAELEAQVLELVRQPSTSPLPAPETAEELLTKDRTDAQSKLRSLERRYLEWVQRASDGLITLRQLGSAVAGIEADRRTTETRLAMADGDPAQLQQWRAGQRRRLETEWDDLNPGQRQELLHGLVDKATLSGRKLDVSLRG